jgi:F420-non-reducing hydrogenase small subunit
MSKGKLALYWAASCGGCEIAVLGIDTHILDVAAAFDIVFWPCATDGKVRDVEKMPDGSIDLCLFNGGIRTSEQEYMAQLMRRKSKVLVAFGSCAHEGCIPGLANLYNRKVIFDTVYKEGSSTFPENPKDFRPQPSTDVPEGKLSLPIFYDTLKTLDQTVEVDYYLPGCPPEAKNIWAALVAVLEGKLPPKGSVIGVNTTVCDECPRKRNEKKIKKFHRTWEIIPDEQTCLLEQGLICCGVATRAGCGALCPQVNSPCIGCHGPNEGVDDYGARLMSALASVIDSQDPAEIQRIIEEGIPDPVGTFYRFSLAASQLRRGSKRAVNGAGTVKHVAQEA